MSSADKPSTSPDVQPFRNTVTTTSIMPLLTDVYSSIYHGLGGNEFLVSAIGECNMCIVMALNISQKIVLQLAHVAYSYVSRDLLDFVTIFI